MVTLFFSWDLCWWDAGFYSGRTLPPYSIVWEPQWDVSLWWHCSEYHARYLISIHWFNNPILLCKEAICFNQEKPSYSVSKIYIQVIPQLQIPPRHPEVGIKCYWHSSQVCLTLVFSFIFFFLNQGYQDVFFSLLLWYHPNKAIIFDWNPLGSW